MSMRRVIRSLVLAVAVLAIPIVGSAVETHYGFNRNSPAGFRLGRAHEGLEIALNGLVAERDTMVQMRDGADCPSDAACYAAVAAAYGFISNAEARGAFLELDALVRLPRPTGVTTDGNGENRGD